MKNWILLTSLSITFLSIANEKLGPGDIALAYQESINNGNIEKALDYWLPEKAKQFEKDNGLILSQLLGDINIIKDTVFSSCNKSSCTVSAQFRNNENELRKVVYTFVGGDKLKLSNIKTQGL